MANALKPVKTGDEALSVSLEKGRGASDSPCMRTYKSQRVLAEPIPPRLSKLVERLRQSERANGAER